MSEKNRLLFVTVGTTAITAQELGKMYRDADERKELVNDIESYQGIDDDRGKAAHATERHLFRHILEAHRLHWDIKNPSGISDNPYRTSAEMTSTYFLMHARQEDGGVGGMFNPEHDRIVLLSSDTAEGKFCARINAQLMHEFLLAPICSGTVDFSKADTCNACKSISVEVVDKMESKTEFKGITEELEKIVKRYADTRRRQTFLNMTGGYKGAIPSLTWLCYEKYPECPLFYQHESMDKAVRIDFLPKSANGASPQERALRLREKIVFVKP